MIPALSTPTTNTTLVAYLDLWERLITPDDEHDLIHPGLGVETCARIKREWAVRVGAAVPAAANGHLYYGLATITRRANTAQISAANVADLREQRLIVPPAHLLADVLGVDPFAYRRGTSRPLVNLREAINALLAGQLPTTADIPVSPGTGPDVLRRGCLAVDSKGGMVVAWQSPRVASTNQIAVSRLDLARVADGFSTPTMVTTGGVHLEPCGGAAEHRRRSPGRVSERGVRRAHHRRADAARRARRAGDRARAADRHHRHHRRPGADGRGRRRHSGALRQRGLHHQQPLVRPALPVHRQHLPGRGARADCRRPWCPPVVCTPPRRTAWCGSRSTTAPTCSCCATNPATGLVDATAAVAATGILDPHVLAISATSAMVFYDDGSSLPHGVVRQ